MIVRQVSNALDLLEFFARTRKPATLAEVSVAMGWPRSSTFNLLSTLEQRGFIYEPRTRGGFYPSTRWLALLQNISDTDLVPEELCHAAHQISHETDETAAIAGPAGINAVLLYVAESSAAVRFSALPGFQVPIHASSVGRALLAEYSARERASLLRKVKYQTYAVQAPMNPEEVEAEIRSETARGWHQTEGTGDDLTGLALPVGRAGRPLAIVVGGPCNRMAGKIPHIVETMKRVLKAHAG